MKLHEICILSGVFLDLCLGDPHSFPHPVRAVGGLISKTEKGIRPLFPASKGGELAGGILLAFLVSAVSGAVFAGVLWMARKAGIWALFAVETVLNYYLLAARSLWDESRKVYERLKCNDTEGARRAVSMIVGRDTGRLDGEGIARAAVETVAENTSDGVIAPLFYLAIGGPVLGWIYKAVNTMDSMVGYENDKYRYFGRAAARLDDLFNLIPSRLSALFLIVSAFLLGFDGKGAFKIWQRDRKNHKSPNSAQTEAACAGALGVRLAGDAWYFGVLHKKPYIGDASRPLEYEDIVRAGRLMYMAEAAALFVFLGALALCCVR